MPFQRLPSDTCYMPGCTEKRMLVEDWTRVHRGKKQWKTSRFCVYHFVEYADEKHPGRGEILCPRRKPKEGLDWMRQGPPPYPHTQEVHWPHPEIAGATPTMEWPLVLVSPA